jgi:acyl-CoA thioesterase I
MNEGVLRVCLAAGLACVVACGSDEKTDTGRNSKETKDNMSITKGAGPTAAAAATSTPTSASSSIRAPVVLFFGTSLTAGLGLNPEQAFPALIEKKAQAEGVPITVINAGLSGETTAGAARRIDWVLRTPADLVVIEAGANDALRGLSPDAARANIEQVIAVVKRKQPAAKIVLIQMEAPPNLGPAYTRSFRTMYGEIAKKEGIPLLPFLLDGVAGIPRLNQPDGMHPNVAGERIVADNVWRALKPIVVQLLNTMAES